MSERYAELRSALIEQPLADPPVLEPDPVAHATVSLEDLVAAEALHVYEAPPTVGGGESAMLSAKDVRLGRAASRWGDADVPGAVLVRSGDVAVVMGTDPAAHVCTDDGVLLGSGIHLLRGSATIIDPQFLAGLLRAAIADGPVDLYRVQIPRVPLANQRRLGAAFRQLAEVEAAWRLRRAAVEQVVRAGVRGLAAGALRPATVDE
ncbi:hypothetical protein FHY52_00280 [Nocardia nova]|uniref:hypothetical protein n=1 Tax=Nocardia nova TaxID=37330 RepID=UPI0025B1CD81|nr:hypothetical protein [Nocardia nova]MDN2495164.1 hypothetical protein [Nocardia nova]